MDMTMQLVRTHKGQEEIFNHGHTLRPKHRQILFSVGNGISFGELRSKQPNCPDLETMVNELLQSGFLQSLRDMAAALVGTKSPAYRKMDEVQDMDGFNAGLPMCRKVIAAVASPHQAAEMEAEAAKRMGR